ncbi:MAG: hypothetical protein WCW57_00360 [Candidatus Pacearchaeota archaeon]
MSEKETDKFLQTAFIAREHYFAKLIREYSPAGLIIGGQHVEFLAKAFPDYRIPYQGGTLPMPAEVKERLGELRARN